LKQKLYPFGVRSDSLGGYGTYDELHIVRTEAFYLAASHRQINKIGLSAPFAPLR